MKKELESVGNIPPEKRTLELMKGKWTVRASEKVCVWRGLQKQKNTTNSVGAI